MINVQDICLSFGEQLIFDHISFNVGRLDRIGLVGRNGSGKSTLFKIVTRLQTPDSGWVSVEKNKKIAYVPQEVVLSSEKAVFEEAFAAFEEISKLEEELKVLERFIDEDNNDPKKIERYAYVQSRLSELGFAQAKVETEKILNGLGFSKERMMQPVNALSVGWRMRLLLAKLLLQKADFYFFDEPTNHLDIVAKDWFLSFLKRAGFGFLLVCHDRYFLDQLCEKIFELGRGELNFYKGNYSSYLTQKEKHEEDLEQAYKQQQKDIKKKKATIERFRYSASKAKMAQSMIKALEKEKIIKLDSKSKNIKFNFASVPRPGRVVLEVEDLNYSFGDKKIFENVTFKIERGEKVALIAPNGIGKTTLFNVIVGNLSQQGGKVDFGYNVSQAIFEQDQDKVLDKNKTIYEEVEDSCSKEARPLIRNFLGTFLFSGDDVSKKIKVLSGGERNRVAMIKVLLQKTNFLLLDEPTNHLDLESREILLNALQQFSGTILFVSHDRDFLNRLATKVIELTPDGNLNYSGNYDDFLYQKEEREKQVSSVENGATAPPLKDKISGKEVFALRKRSRNLESKIEKLEKDKNDLQSKLEKLDYETEDYKAIYDKLLECDKELGVCLAEWEELQSKMM